MQIRLTRPELERFIDDQVKAGNYPSAEAVVEAAVADLREAAGAELDEETIAAINRAEEQLDRGEGIPFERFADEMRRRLAAE